MTYVAFGVGILLTGLFLIWGVSEGVAGSFRKKGPPR